MARIDFHTMDLAEKGAIFDAIAAELGMTAFAVEKDWWVSRSLNIIFQMDIGGHLVFKGGTSLSKAWKLINQFSEDIDLAIDKEFFKGFKGDISRMQIGRLRKEAGIYTTVTFYSDLQEAFRTRGLHDLAFKVIDSGESDQDSRIIEIHYPNIIAQPSEYVLPRVQIEVGCRSLREPFTVQRFGSLVDERFPDLDFAEPLFSVPTVNPERTFLEKLFLLQEEFHRPEGKIRVDRLSRHLYDVYHLTRAGVASTAIGDKELYQTIVNHRYRYSRIGEVDYNLHNPKTLNPIPVDGKIAEWKADYAKLMVEMIYEEDKPSFDDMIENLVELRKQLKKQDWTFEPAFPRPARNG